MDYFDDMRFITVSKMITRRNGSPGRQACAALGLMLSGPAIRCSHDASVRIEAPFLYWSRAGSVCCWKTPPGAIRENLWCVAKGPRFDRMLDSLDRVSPAGHLPLARTGKIVECFDRMRCIFERGTDNERRRLPFLAEELMRDIAESIPETDAVSGKMLTVIREAADAMADEPGRYFDIDRLAHSRGISPGYLRHSFKKHTGKSAYEFLLAQRYALAVRFLRETDIPVGEIAEKCGFPLQRLFTRFFKTRAGVSPREFRKKIF